MDKRPPADPAVQHGTTCFEKDTTPDAQVRKESSVQNPLEAAIESRVEACGRNLNAAQRSSGVKRALTWLSHLITSASQTVQKPLRQHQLPHELATPVIRLHFLFKSICMKRFCKS